MTSLSVDEYVMNYLQELARAAVVCGMGLHWITTVGAMTALSAEGYCRKYLIELAREDLLWECVGARLVELIQV